MAENSDSLPEPYPASQPPETTSFPAPVVSVQVTEPQSASPKKKWLLVSLIVFLLCLLLSAIGYAYFSADFYSTTPIQVSDDFQLPAQELIATQRASVGKKKLYPFPKDINFSPQTELDLDRPLLTMWSWGFDAIEIVTAEGARTYRGPDLDPTQLYELYDGIDEISLDGVGNRAPEDFELAMDTPLKSSKYIVTLSNVDQPKTDEVFLDINYGFGDLYKQTFFSIRFFEDKPRVKPFIFEITPEGIWVDEEEVPLGFEVDSQAPVDATPPQISGTFIEGSPRSIDVQFTDDRVITKSECAYIRTPTSTEGYLSDEYIPTVYTSAYFPYNQPLQEKRAAGETLICRAFDKTGNHTEWSDDWIEEMQRLKDILEPSSQ